MGAICQWGVCVNTVIWVIRRWNEWFWHLHCKLSIINVAISLQISSHSWKYVDEAYKRYHMHTRYIDGIKIRVLTKKLLTYYIWCWWNVFSQLLCTVVNLAINLQPSHSPNSIMFFNIQLHCVYVRGILFKIKAFLYYILYSNVHTCTLYVEEKRETFSPVIVISSGWDQPKLKKLN